MTDRQGSRLVNPDQLRALLSKPEAATLDFKREFYKLNDPDQLTKEKQRGEFTKDILALANGNAANAGETAYLIIGADDAFVVLGSQTALRWLLRFLGGQLGQVGASFSGGIAQDTGPPTSP